MNRRADAPATTTPQDAARLQAAALTCIQHCNGHEWPLERDACPLGREIPPGVYPTVATFLAVEAATGATDGHRLDRWLDLTVAASAASESAWCRAELRRWAVKHYHRDTH
jgi:hypothetical protein